jgi:hypothetical protein
MIRIEKVCNRAVNPKANGRREKNRERPSQNYNPSSPQRPLGKLVHVETHRPSGRYVTHHEGTKPCLKAENWRTVEQGNFLEPNPVGNAHAHGAQIVNQGANSHEACQQKDSTKVLDKHGQAFRRSVKVCSGFVCLHDASVLLEQHLAFGDLLEPLGVNTEFYHQRIAFVVSRQRECIKKMHRKHHTVRHRG